MDSSGLFRLILERRGTYNPILSLGGSSAPGWRRSASKKPKKKRQKYTRWLASSLANIIQTPLPVELTVFHVTPPPHLRCSRPAICRIIKHLTVEDTTTLALRRSSPQHEGDSASHIISLQPIAAPPSVPHPSPSPGLPQGTFSPGQPTSVVFATPQLQMNTAPQPRQFAAGPRALNQQPYYQNRPGLPGAAPRQPSSSPRPVAPTHVYQPGAQMMMISQQQLPFANAQSTAYFIPPGQYRSTYVATAPQYSMPAGTTGFYPGPSPAEYAGAYYPAQPQYPPSVPPAPVIINPPQPQPAPPPQPPVQTKRERKQSPPLAHGASLCGRERIPALLLSQGERPPSVGRRQIRIRDPNQGGRDITEEIMSCGRSASTPTPPQCAVAGSEGGSPIQANGECALPAVTMARPDDGEDSTAPIAVALTPPCSTSPEPAPTEPSADWRGPGRDSPVSSQGEDPVPPGEAPDDAPDDAPPEFPAAPSSNSSSDSVDTPTPPPAPALTPPPATSAPTDEQPLTLATTEEPTAPETEEERVQQVKGGEEAEEEDEELEEEGGAVSNEEATETEQEEATKTEQQQQEEEAAPVVIEADLAPRRRRLLLHPSHRRGTRRPTLRSRERDECGGGGGSPGPQARGPPGAPLRPAPGATAPPERPGPPRGRSGPRP
ncbi:hypothetical protein AAFF_G00248040 [Aldrovandia affinis]|uniref:Uncharacterized protein n=1 Tax=Aldrovandia affinis TaxID=143900 RepID=A0AAD7RDV4_9TELE|nr:hypothetical protein AAFF_G00248040 [Aldrovandia affinis]